MVKFQFCSIDYLKADIIFRRTAPKLFPLIIDVVIVGEEIKDHRCLDPAFEGIRDQRSMLFKVTWNGINRPTCCTFPVYTGVVIVLPIAAVALFMRELGLV